MELEEVIERLEGIKTLLEIDNGANLEMTPKQQKLLAQNLEVVLNHLTKQEKMIDLMAQWIGDRCLYEDTDSNYCEITQDGCYEWNVDCKQCIKQYFEKKAEESE